MTLITGGAYSGKTEFAIKKFNIKSTDIIDGAECSLEHPPGKPGFDHNNK